jgi:hypothetical protein
VVVHGNLGGPFSMAYSGSSVLAPRGVICLRRTLRIKPVIAVFRSGFGQAY